MKIILKLLIFSLLFTSLYFLFPHEIQAICPVCTVAVGAGLGLSRYLGIDDTISGIWVGGLILSTSFWFIDWLSKKYPKTKIKNQKLLVILLMYSLVLLPLWWGKVIGDPFNTILGGIDKLIFGTAVGSFVFLLGMWADKKVREVRGKQLFQFQKVVFPVTSLVIVSLVLYYYGGYLY